MFGTIVLQVIALNETHYVTKFLEEVLVVIFYFQWGTVVHKTKSKIVTLYYVLKKVFMLLLLVNSVY